MLAVKHELVHQAVSLLSFRRSYCKRLANVIETLFSCGIAVNQQLSRATCQIECRAEVSVSLYDAIATPRISTQETGAALATAIGLLP